MHELDGVEYSDEKIKQMIQAVINGDNKSLKSIYGLLSHESKIRAFAIAVANNMDTLNELSVAFKDKIEDTNAKLYLNIKDTVLRLLKKDGKYYIDPMVVEIFKEEGCPISVFKAPVDKYAISITRKDIGIILAVVKPEEIFKEEE